MSMINRRPFELLDKLGISKLRAMADRSGNCKERVLTLILRYEE